jgi:hypothetical protein
MSTVLSKEDNQLLTPNSTREDGSNKSELIEICDMLQHDTRCHNHACKQMVATQHELLLKTEVILVIKFDASMHILRIKIPVRHYSTDAIDDRVILLFDPGGSQEKKMAESIVCC